MREQMASSARVDRSLKTRATLPPAGPCWALLGGQGVEGGWWGSGPGPLKRQEGVSAGLGCAQELGDLHGVTALFLSFSLGICKMVGVEHSPHPS